MNTKVQGHAPELQGNEYIVTGWDKLANGAYSRTLRAISAQAAVENVRHKTDGNVTVMAVFLITPMQGEWK